MEIKRRTVYRNGTVRFLHRLYKGDCLKNHEGSTITLLFDPGHILEMRAYALEEDGTLGEFLGYIRMINQKNLVFIKTDLKQVISP